MTGYKEICPNGEMHAWCPYCDEMVEVTENDRKSEMDGYFVRCDDCGQWFLVTEE